MPEDGGLIGQALIGLKPVNAWVHTYTKPQISSTRSRSLGWRIHESVEDTKLSTNKQNTLSPPPGPVTGKTRGSGGERRCLGCRRPQGVCPEPPRQRSPPLPRMRARGHRFQGACQGCSITPPGPVTGKTRGSGGERRCPGCRRPQGVCPINERAHCSLKCQLIMAQLHL